MTAQFGKVGSVNRRSNLGTYRFGSITIDGRSFDADVIVYPDRVKDHWWRREGHRLGALP